MDCLLKIESGAAEAFAALEKIAMLGACRSEDEPWGKRMSVGVPAGLPAEGSAQAGVLPTGGGWCQHGGPARIRGRSEAEPECRKDRGEAPRRCFPIRQ